MKPVFEPLCLNKKQPVGRPGLQRWPADQRRRSPRRLPASVCRVRDAAWPEARCYSRKRKTRTPVAPPLAGSGRDRRTERLSAYSGTVYDGNEQKAP